MAFSIRRIVTGHDARGKAVITEDKPVAAFETPAKSEVVLLWKTDKAPVDLNDTSDGALKQSGFAPSPQGSIFRIVEFPPNNPANMHVTETVDYGIVLDGEIDMDLDDSTVHMKAGDVMIQRATIHAWINKGDKPCRMAFVLLDAKK